MKRVAIVGNAAGGNSTLARRLAEAIVVPRYALDHIQWSAGWTPAPPGEFARAHRRLVRREAWIIDGLGAMTSVAELIAALGKCGAGKRVVGLRSPGDIAAFLRRAGVRGAPGTGR